MDSATINQIKLLAEAMKAQSSYEQIFDSLLALLVVYTPENAKELNRVLAQVLGVEYDEQKSRGSNLEMIVGGIVAVGVRSGMKKEQAVYWGDLLLKDFKRPVSKNDSTNIAQAVKKFKNGVDLVVRHGIFDKSNQRTLERARELGQKVFWRSRLNADGWCKKHDKKLMTPSEFDELWPIHPNCMCTAELIPETDSILLDKRSRADNDSGIIVPSDEAYTKRKIERGEWGKSINDEKQAPHNYETRQAGKSYLAKGVDAQELFDKYAGTGVLVRQRDESTRTNVERVNVGHVIGYDGDTGRQATWVKIHHSKKRTHIVPYLGDYE